MITRPCVRIHTMKRVNVSIREDQHEWARNNESFNLSGFIREKLDEEMSDE